MSAGKITVQYEAGSLSGAAPVLEVFGNPMGNDALPAGTLVVSPILEIHGAIIPGKQVMISFPIGVQKWLKKKALT